MEVLLQEPAVLELLDEAGRDRLPVQLRVDDDGDARLLARADLIPAERS